MENTLVNKLQEAVQDHEFMVALGNAENVENFTSLLNSKSIEVNAQEAQALFDSVKRAKNGYNDELTEASLDTVSGGWVGWAIAGGCAFLYGVYKSWTE